MQLDKVAQQGRIKHWVRNLVNKPGCAFFLQKATGRVRDRQWQQIEDALD